MDSAWSRMPIDSNDVQIVSQVQQFWNTGNQPIALQTLRPLAEAGKPWAAALMSWLLMQQGQPGIEESITWAIRAAQLGLPYQALNTFNTALQHIPAMPQLTNRMPELLENGAPWGPGIDPVGQGWNLVAQGQTDLGVRLMMLPPAAPFNEPQWKALLARSQEHSQAISDSEASTNSKLAKFDEHITAAHESVTKAQDDLSTSARQAGLLVTAVTSEATNALYKADAVRNTAESRVAWIGGLVVLGLAAAVAALPVMLHYAGQGPTYSSGEQIALHVASTAALGGFAGVLLARARSRDRAAQRANDLSTAMGTMIAYSNQIADQTEKQRFMTTMGQVVLQAHLATTSSGGGKEDRSDLLAIANLVRSSTGASSTST